MEYETKVKQIGGSSYLRLPPKLVKTYGLKDQSEVQVRESDRMFLVTVEKPKIDEAGLRLLKMMKKGCNLGGGNFSRQEIYETDRY